jgi:polysaccharide biosynthesis protein VpsQ
VKYIAVTFAIFIVGVIILADRNALPPFIRAIYDFPNGDKLGHFILFGLLNFFVTRAILASWPSQSRGWLTLSVGCILALLITLEEYSQKFYPSRTFDVLDLLASCMGLLAGGWLAFRLNRRGHFSEK